MPVILKALVDAVNPRNVVPDPIKIHSGRRCKKLVIQFTSRSLKLERWLRNREPGNTVAVRKRDARNAGRLRAKVRSSQNLFLIITREDRNRNREVRYATSVSN